MKIHYWYIRPKFEIRDIWIGIYWKRFPAALDVYVCLLPCLPLNFYIQWHTNK